VGAFETYANVTFATQANLNLFETYANLTYATKTALQTLDANVGAFETYANVTFSTQANAASQQTQINTLNSEFATLNANVGAFETYANATFSTSTYANANVSAYLASNISTPIGTTANVYAGNLITTSGVYWANGAAYSTPFSGNLLGSTLTDSVNTRVLIQPSTTGQMTYAPGTLNYYSTNQTLAVTTNAVSYISGNIVNAAIDGTILFASNAAIGLQSSYNTALKYIYGQNNYLQVTPVTANSMTAGDRIRGTGFITEILGNNTVWGSINAGAAVSSYVISNSAFTNYVGPGSIGALVGMSGASYASPTATASANVQYTSSYFGFAGYNNATPALNRQASSIVYARIVSGSIGMPTPLQSNVTITNAVMIHVPNAWAVYGSGTVTNRYALFNEDNTTSIQTNGNIVFGNAYTGAGGNVAASGYLINAKDRVIALGTTSGAVSLDVSQGSTWTITLNGTLTLSTATFLSAFAGTSATLIVTQDATGSRPLSTSGIKWAGGNNTLSVPANAIDVINFYYDGTNWLGSLVNGYV
jgi:hypothetical protein